MSPRVFVLLALLCCGSTLHLHKAEGRLIYEKSLNNTPMNKILGGSGAEYGEYPFIVSLEWNGMHICGGSVISSNWLVTAAHCLRSWAGLVIRAGSMTKEEGGTVHQVLDVIQHSEFNINPMFDSDIALVKNGRGESSTNLLDVALKIINNDNCDSAPGIERIRRNGYAIVKINHNMICAIADHKDTTKGDSGGPLIKYKDDGKDPLLVGIVSWGEGSGQLDSPGVYSNVANFIEWIYLHTVSLPGRSMF
ncbi:trypsin epsilon-like isoform X2 [Bacillus rossius redtenbacheri]|uniref:trypsin epsilon-like isoform X2 n=1 Tax=Bacillus rossius redtenbacheri TaxID=93214 RepID=UPI002FDE62E3